MAQAGNLHKDQRVTLDFFVMAEMGNLTIKKEKGNLDTCLGVALVYFHNGRGISFIRKVNRSDGYYNQSCWIDGWMFFIFV